MTNPVVSVVVPTYKHCAFVLGALESVWAQAETFAEPFEVIVVNDGSPDDTHTLLQPLAEAGRIVYIEQGNKGQPTARNVGIHRARGEFIALLDDDDVWPAGRMARQVAALRANPEAGVVYGVPLPVNDRNDEIEPRDWYGDLLPWPWTAPGGNVYDAMIERSWPVTPGQATIRRAALETLDGPTFADGPFDAALRGTDDWDLWLRLAERWEFVSEAEIALRYRLHVGNASQDTLKMRRLSFAFYEKHLRRNARNPERHAKLLAQYQSFRYHTVFYLLQQAYLDRQRGDLPMALGKLNYVLRERPWVLRKDGAWKFYLVTLLRSLKKDAAPHDVVSIPDAQSALQQR